MSNSHRGRKHLAVTACFAGLLSVLLAPFAPESIAETPQRTRPVNTLTPTTTPRPVSRIPAGTVIGKQAPQGWSHIVMFAKPRLGSGDVDSVPGFAAKYASMLNFAVLAKVGGEAGSRAFEQLAIGYAVEIGGKNVVITSDTQKRLGANLGYIERQVLSESEECLNDVMQICHFPTMIIFDAEATMLRDGDHQDMVMRHLVWVNANDGRLATAIWLLDKNGENGYRTADDTLQVLPSNYHEDRVLHVNSDKFVLGVPTKDAFALKRVAPGKTVKLTPTLRKLAAAKRYDKLRLRELAIELNRAIRDSSKQ